MAAEASPPIRIVVLCLAFALAASVLFLAGPLAERSGAQEGSEQGSGCPSDDPTVYCEPTHTTPDDEPPEEPTGENPLGEGTYEDPDAPPAPEDIQPDDEAPPEGTVEVEGGATASNDTLIVTYEESAAEAEKDAAKADAEAAVDSEVAVIDAEVVEVPEAASGDDLEARKEGLEADAAVESVDYDELIEISWTPNDPLYVHSQQANIRAVDALRAWNFNRGGGSRIAILDTGCFMAHSDLRYKVVAQRDLFNKDPYANDAHGHGTHVASIAAARTNNGLGMAGGAPGAKILCGRITDDGGFSSNSKILNGLKWAMNNNADVVNLSFGRGSYSQALANMMQTLYQRGIFVAASSGNDNLVKQADYPSAYPYVMAVAGTTRDGSDRYHTGANSGSNCGPYVDIAAPGVTIWGADVGSGRNGYTLKTGASMAAPHVSAAAALLVQRGMKAHAIHSRLQRSADDRGNPGRDHCFGSGLVDFHGAITLID